ncbi:hypothetical protein [Pseudomonas sp. GXZC]|uniref:hypothetical protein n=1 Tax=Pseudomonas sp. GXZC TaxID=3003351 RepID=UPI0022AA3AD2|nr:hypothetical protein [Pseudomonas sp. GXZC]WAT28557.1 hypothetical protein OZ428_32235 [Pseudomonas sp. GXZC]
MAPVKRVEFSYPRSDLTHPDSGVAQLGGNYIVWWYAKMRQNIRACSMPLVDVYFRSLKKNVPSTGQFVSLPLSSIPHYRIGTIWRQLNSPHMCGWFAESFLHRITGDNYAF